MSRKTALALRHVGFEDLGTFAAPLVAAGYAIAYHDVGIDDLAALDPLGPDLLVVLGGPIGVYETEAYPFLADEIALLRARLAAQRPTLGICLGAQLMAAALGAQVSPSGTKEIGFAPIALTEAGAAGPLRHLEGVAVLHWHGDMFAIPAGAASLAATPACSNQGFAIGAHALGLQFHPECDAARIEQWLIGHACELATSGIAPGGIRDDAVRHGVALRAAADLMMRDWLAALG
jgi:GMP synthase (glutamine-hydrolysing)